MKNLLNKVQEFLQNRGWDQLRPSDLSKSISIEAAELLEIFQWSSLSLEETSQDPEKMKNIKKELADIMIYCLELSVLLKIDTEQIILDKLDHNDKKYPAELMKNTAKTKVGSEDMYLKIKKDYRRKGLN